MDANTGKGLMAWLASPLGNVIICSFSAFFCYLSSYAIIAPFLEWSKKKEMALSHLLGVVGGVFSAIALFRWVHCDAFLLILSVNSAIGWQIVTGIFYKYVLQPKFEKKKG